MNRTYTLRPFNYRESAPFSGTGPADRREHENDACAPLPRRNPSDLGSTAASHRINARGQAEARPTKTKSRSASHALAAIALAAITLATIAAPAARAQGSRKDDIVFGPAGHPVSGPTITVCAPTATGTPCSPLAAIYTDATLTVPAPNPF
jgi:hypothetical protein